MIPSHLNQPKEPTPYFHLSLFQEKTCDMLHPLSGFYKLPTLAYYGAGYPFGDMVGLIALPGNLINLPKNVIDVIENVPEVMQYQREPTKGGKIFDPVNIDIPRVRSVRFYWVVTDISELVHKVCII
jgi:hypothetical protein